MLKKIVITIFVLLITAGCTNSITYNSLSEYDMLEIEEQVNKYSEYYFSENIKTVIKKYPEIEDGVFSIALALKSLQQKSIKDSVNTSYRYIYAQNGGRPREGVLIEYKNSKQGGKVTLFKYSESNISNKNGVSIDKKTYKLTPTQIENFEKNIQFDNFKALYETGSIYGDDGGYRLLEGTKNGQYHFIIRWSGDSELDNLFNTFTDLLNKAENT